MCKEMYVVLNLDIVFFVVVVLDVEFVIVVFKMF